MPNPPRASSRLAGFSILAVLLLAGAGLFSLHLSQTEGGAALRSSVMSAELTDKARTAQVGFKVQVQHWKNYLLRGHNPDDLSTYTDRFMQQEKLVQATLLDLTGHEMLPASVQSEMQALQMEHLRLGDIYRSGMARFTPGDFSSSFEVDRSVRGIDQDLSARIDAVAEAILVDQEAQAVRMEHNLEQRYATARFVTTLSTIALLFLVTFMAWKMRRPVEL
jgi:hypothetical protein